MRHWITNISEWWLQEVEGTGSPLPNIFEQLKPLSVPKPIMLFQRKPNTDDST